MTDGLAYGMKVKISTKLMSCALSYRQISNMLKWNRQYQNIVRFKGLAKSLHIPTPTRPASMEATRFSLPLLDIWAINLLIHLDEGASVVAAILKTMAPPIHLAMALSSKNVELPPFFWKAWTVS
jgi:hypothetical protein